MMHASARNGLRCEWVIGYTHFNQMLRERMRTYVIGNAEKERHIRRRKRSFFQLFPSCQRSWDRIWHATYKLGMWVCVFIPRFLRESVCFVGREVEERWKNSFSPSWNWLLRLCFQGQCDHHTHPGELKSPRHMHTLLLSLSRLILCSGHTFPYCSVNH